MIQRQVERPFRQTTKPQEYDIGAKLYFYRVGVLGPERAVGRRRFVSASALRRSGAKRAASVLDRTDSKRRPAPGLGPPRPAQHAGAGEGAHRTDGCSRQCPPRALTQRGGMAVSRLVGRGVSLSRAGVSTRCVRRDTDIRRSAFLAAQLASRRIMRQWAFPSNSRRTQGPSFPLRRSRALCLGSSAIRLRRSSEHGH
jgi:hypothetical protein